MIAPLDLTTEEMEVYKILYSKMDFETYLVKYTLDQIVNDSNSKLLMTKKKTSLIIKHFISDNLLTVEEKGSKGNPTVYKITKINDILEKHKRTLNETQTELKGNVKETNKPSDTNVSEDNEKHKSNTTETQTELKGNTKVTPIKDKEKDKEIIYSKEFEEFYKIYPNPFNKEQTFRSWKTSLKKDTLENIMTATNNYIKYVTAKNTEKQYIVRSTNFLGQKQEYKGYLEMNINEKIAVGQNSKVIMYNFDED